MLSWAGVEAVEEAGVLALGSIVPLLAFVKEHRLRTGFNYLLISYLLVNLIFSVFLMLLAWDFYFDGWLMAPGFCAPYISSVFLASFLTGWIQVLITTNRLWALFFPHHYRTRHNKRSSGICCVSAWLIAALPNGRCFGKQMRLLPKFTSFFWNFADVPPVLILVVYPFLLKKYLSRRRTRTPPPPSSSVQNRNTSTRPVKDNMASSSGERQGGEVRTLEAVLRSKVKFLVLTWVVVCIVCFWSPLLIFSLIQNLKGNSMVKGNEFITMALVFNWMLICQCVEPWIFVLTIPLLRQTVRRLLCGTR
ncbi:hypothetical protein RvY_04569 [Ramazzottius varieornatus]|uniref:G-protein coupled receptors family 1 profile domain-containing protein n=1 Tax=Ramazzottius varieornatus TaxID=947166 RepID=A0A1D1V187_RAMVA|nr:hypothetical protein RvY_04569 [Ramazzottius varieornatus]